MARRRTGSIVERGDVFALRVTCNGRRHFVRLGTREDGWTRARAHEELQNVLADIRRGIWEPPRRGAPPQERADPTFHEFASAWFEAISSEGLRPNTLADYEWQLTLHLLPFFKVHRLLEITVAEVDRYRQAKVREGRLSATSINKTITRLGQILELAAERELIARNPVRVNPRRRKLRQARPERPYLESAEQIEALLNAAGEMDRAARGDRRATPRRALLATLAFAGLRIGEALDLRWQDVDLAQSRVKVGKSKTDAGVRTVNLLPALRDELAAHKATASFAQPGDCVFPTHNGKRQNPSNVRNRILAPAIARANEALSGSETQIPAISPHALRRTFASILFALGSELPYAMEQLGHRDPRMTLGVYARVMLGGETERRALESLVYGGPDRVVRSGSGPTSSGGPPLVETSDSWPPDDRRLALIDRKTSRGGRTAEGVTEDGKQTNLRDR